MAEFTAQEQMLFAKYWGVKDLHLNDEFWTEVLIAYNEKVVPVPLVYSPQSCRRVLDMLECPSGKCGLCCRYENVPIDNLDMKRIADNTEWDWESLGCIVKANDQGGLFIPCAGGCPFLLDNACSIYDYRPNTCYFFPINTPRKGNMAGQPVDVMTIRVKCPSSVNIIRTLVHESLVSGGILLPDLTIIPPYKEE